MAGTLSSLYGAKPTSTKKEAGERKGLGRLLFGKKGIDPLGVASFGKELAGIPRGLSQLASSFAPGGQKPGQVWGDFGRGVVSPFFSLLGGTEDQKGFLDDWLRAGWRGIGGSEETAPKDLLQNIYDRGLVSGIAEPVSAIAGGGALAKGGLQKFGNAATKATVLEHATARAVRRGVTEEALGAAGEVGRTATGFRGVSRGLKERGLGGEPLRDVAKATKRLERAGGQEAAAAARAAGRTAGSTAYPKVFSAAHPYRALFDNVSLEARAAMQARFSRVNAPAAAAESAARGARFAEETAEAAEPFTSQAPPRPGTVRVEGLDLGLEAPSEARAAARAAGRQADEAAFIESVGGIGEQRGMGPAEAAIRRAQETPVPESVAARAAARSGKIAAADEAGTSPGLAGKAEDVLVGVGGKIQARQAMRIRNEYRRFMEADKRRTLKSEAVSASRKATAELVKTGLSRKKADRLVGDTLMAMIDNRAVLQRLITQDHPLAGDSGFMAFLDEKMGRKYSLSAEQRDLIQPYLDEALEQWNVLAEQRKQTLLASTKGAKGLDDLDFDTADFDATDLLTPQQNRQLSRLLDEYETRYNNMNPERRAAAMRAKEALAGVSSIDRAVAAMERTARDLTDATRRLHEAALPAALRGPARAATVARIMERINDGVTSGGTLDLNTGRWLEQGEYDAAVGVTGRVLDVGDETPQAINQFIEDYAGALGDQDAKIGIWINDGKLYLDVSQTTINGRRMSREEAYILGTARAEKSIWDSAGQEEVFLTPSATSQQIAAAHVKELMKPKSQFTRFVHEITRSRQAIEALQEQAAVAGALAGGEFSLNLNPQAWQDKVTFFMHIAPSAIGNGTVKSLDQFYGQLATETRKTQAIPEQAMLQVFLGPNPEVALRNLPETWNQAIEQAGPAGKKILDWYFDGYNTVASLFDEADTIQLPRIGEDGVIRLAPVNTREFVWSVIAATSVDTAPHQNMQVAFDGIMGLADYNLEKVDVEKLGKIVQEYQARVKGVRSSKKINEMAKLMGGELWNAIAPKIPHPKGARVKADVMDIITDRLVGEWDTDWVFRRGGAEGVPATLEQSPWTKAERAAVAGKLADEGTTYEALVAAAKSGDAAAETRLRDLYGSRAIAKIRNFYANLSNPAASQGVTLDRVMAQAFGLADENWSGPAYEQAVRAMTEFADQISEVYGVRILPHQVQALIWVATKTHIAEVELGRRYAVGMDAIALLEEDGLAARQVFLEGRDPVTQWIQGQIDFIEGQQGAVARPRTEAVRIPEVQLGSTVSQIDTKAGAKGLRESVEALKGAPAQQRTFFENVPPEDARKFHAASMKWALEQHERILEALAETDKKGNPKPNVQKAKDVIARWMAATQSDYDAPAQYYSNYLRAGRPDSPKIAGIGEGISASAARARETGLIPEELRPYEDLSQVPEQALEALTPEQMEGVRPELGTVEPNAEVAFQRGLDDLANGLTYMDTKTGRATMRYFRTADPTTLLHESAHVLRLLLPQRDIQTLIEAFGAEGAAEVFGRRKITPPGQTKAARMVKAFGPEGFEEWFAETVLQHMATGVAPAGLDDVFGRMRQGLAHLYEGVGDEALRAIDPGVVDLINNYLDPHIAGLDTTMPEFGRDLSKPAAALAQAEKARPGETAAQAFRRGEEIGKQAERVSTLQRKLAERTAAVNAAERSFESLIDTLNEADLPPEVAKQRRLAKLQGQADKLIGKAERPKSWESVLPPHWKPIGAAMDSLRAAINDPVYGTAVAQALEGVPESMTEFMDYARQNGLDPVHVAQMSDQKVRQLIYGRLEPASSALESGQRLPRKGRFAQSAHERSVNALIAAQLDVIRERETNAFMRTIKETMAVRIPKGGQIPEGFVAWDEVSRFMGVSLDVDSGLLEAIGPNAAQFAVPEAVAKAIKHANRNLDIPVLSGARKVLNPWRNLVLTFRPGWYVNNIVGNVILATTEGGVRLSDWAKAWSDFRKGKRGEELFARFGVGEDVTGLRGGHGGQAEQILGYDIESDIAPSMAYREAREAGRTRVEAGKERYIRTRQKLLNANTIVDEFARTAAYYAGKRQGLSEAAALQKSFQALVDYNDLGPVERSLVRTVVPFYAWQKGILKILANYAIDHPARIGIMYQLGKVSRDQLSDLPEYYRDLVDTPLGPISPRALNPFSDSTNLLSSEGIVNSMHPALEAVVRSALNAPEQGYTDVYEIDQFGRKLPSVDPASSMLKIGTSLPQFRAVEDLQGAAGFAGLPPIRSDEQLAAARERYLKSQQALNVEGVPEAEPKRRARRNPFVPKLDIDLNVAPKRLIDLG